MEKLIIRNALKCNSCEEVIQSTHQHDYVECYCKSTMVDGGNIYLRGGGKDFTNLSITTNIPFIPKSVQLENSPVILAAHHPDTCVGSICALHKRTKHEMRQWTQSVYMIGATFVVTRICPHGLVHTDPDDFYIYDIEYCVDCSPNRKEIVYV